MFNEYPYTSFEKINLDWLLDLGNKLKADAENGEFDGERGKGIFGITSIYSGGEVGGPGYYCFKFGDVGVGDFVIGYGSAAGDNTLYLMKITSVSGNYLEGTTLLQITGPRGVPGPRGEPGEGGLTEAMKQALLQLARKVAYIDGNGQTYYNALYAAFYGGTPVVVLDSITAVFNQGSTAVYDTDTLDSLKSMLTVTAHYSDNSTATVSSTDYTLNGTLAEGTSTVTVSYENKTTTFNVTVSASPKSDMNGWVDGIKYTDLDVIENSYVKKANGSIAAYNGWDRTGYVPCDGVEYLIIPPNSAAVGDAQNNCFYNSEKQWLSSFSTVKSATTDINVVSVPSDAHYFIISNGSAILAAIVNGGIIPNDDSRPRWTSGVPYSPSVFAPSESGKYITANGNSMLSSDATYTRSFIVDCEGASKLTISAELGNDLKYCHFYSDDLTPLGNFLTNKQSETVISIPSGTKFFCMSALTTIMDAIFNGSITVTPST